MPTLGKRDLHRERVPLETAVRVRDDLDRKRLRLPADRDLQDRGDFAIAGDSRARP